jgi:hypothetical protein
MASVQQILGTADWWKRIQSDENRLIARLFVLISVELNEGRVPNENLYGDYLDYSSEEGMVIFQLDFSSFYCKLVVSTQPFFLALVFE